MHLGGDRIEQLLMTPDHYQLQRLILMRLEQLSPCPPPQLVGQFVGPGANPMLLVSPKSGVVVLAGIDFELIAQIVQLSARRQISPRPCAVGDYHPGPHGTRLGAKGAQQRARANCSRVFDGARQRQVLEDSVVVRGEERNRGRSLGVDAGGGIDDAVAIRSDRFLGGAIVSLLTPHALEQIDQDRPSGGGPSVDVDAEQRPGGAVQLGDGINHWCGPPGGNRRPRFDRSGGPRNGDHVISMRCPERTRRRGRMLSPRPTSDGCAQSPRPRGT